MPRYWMIANRNVRKSNLGPNLARLSLWTSDASSVDDLQNLEKWERKDNRSFKRLLIDATDEFPQILDLDQHEHQKHVTLFVHGYNNDWQDAVARYRKLCDDLYEGEDGLGVCILFTWPSDGMVTNYLPDRVDARRAAPDLAEVLSEFYDWLIRQQAEGAANPEKSCRAKTSVIAHSMGNYVLQKAMQQAWTRKNQPALVSLVNQLLMVAADVDNDIFGDGEDRADGEAVANLTYRVIALYTGMDSVLGMSAGLKHFGTRRLGRSGLAAHARTPDNVCDVDCTPFFQDHDGSKHSAYFEVPETVELMRHIVRGVDRDVLRLRGLAPARHS